MEEIALQLLLALAEIVLELAGEIVFDLITRAAGDAFVSGEPRNRIATTFACGLLGVMVGGASVTIFPHPIFHPLRVRGLSLLISPLVTAQLMSMLGQFFRKRGQKVMPIETFPVAFAFAF